jgi:acyl-CoA hydrolase
MKAAAAGELRMTRCAAMARHPADTVSVLTYRTGIQDANLAGNVHGGWIMKLCDDVAVIAATRLAGGRVVTAAVDAMKFRSPVKVGDVITLRATVNAAWRTSMEVGVRVEAEHVPTGEVAHTCTAYLTMVSLGEDEKPVLLPALEPRLPRTSGATATTTTVARSGSRRPARCAASTLNLSASDAVRQCCPQVAAARSTWECASHRQLARPCFEGSKWRMNRMVPGGQLVGWAVVSAHAAHPVGASLGYNFGDASAWALEQPAAALAQQRELVGRVAAMGPSSPSGSGMRAPVRWRISLPFTRSCRDRDSTRRRTGRCPVTATRTAAHRLRRTSV